MSGKPYCGVPCRAEVAPRLHSHHASFCHEAPPVPTQRLDRRSPQLISASHSAYRKSQSPPRAESNNNNSLAFGRPDPALRPRHVGGDLRYPPWGKCYPYLRLRFAFVSGSAVRGRAFHMWPVWLLCSIGVTRRSLCGSRDDDSPV
jgi:hypothetical protein